VLVTSGSGRERIELPPPPAAALAVPRPEALHGSSHASVWSALRRPATARVAPRAGARPIARLGTRAPEGTANTVQVIGGRLDSGGRTWVRARLPVLPNGTTGWLPRGAEGGYRVVLTHLVIDRSAPRATLLREGRTVFRARVGVGLPVWPTPQRRFYVRAKLVRYRSPFYGPLAFGTSARSSKLTDWPEGGFVGIHGTNRPDQLPGRVSHGCIRMRNTDIVRLGRLMPVGTPVTIR
jgi:L,D-transpeptidase catalytic domain